MAERGLSQVDFAIASGMFILIFASLIIFSSNYFQALRSDATITERQGLALSLSSDILTGGYPADWEKNLHTFINNSAANSSRSLERETNATISSYTTGQLSFVDGTNAIIDSSAGADAMEISFPDLNIPQDARIGTVSFMVYYNASVLDKQYGGGDYKDDMYYNPNGTESYLEDWGDGPTSGALLLWNSSDFGDEISSPYVANSLLIRLYYMPPSSANAYFDQVNASVSYSYYPFYPTKLGLSSSSYSFEVLLNNSIADLGTEKVIVNLSRMGYPDSDQNSVIVYNESGSLIPCQISGNIVSFNANIANNTCMWFRIWLSRNSTSNFSSAACSASISGNDNLTTSNRNETVYPPHESPVLSFRKLDALNRSQYRIMKRFISPGYDFHVSLRAASGATVMEYGGDVPRKGDIDAVKKSVLFQNSSAGIEEGFMTVYIWT